MNIKNWQIRFLWRSLVARIHASAKIINTSELNEISKYFVRFLLYVHLRCSFPITCAFRRIPSWCAYTKYVKVGPDNATLLLGTRDSVPMEHCFHAVSGCCKCYQQCRIAWTERLGTLGSYPTLLEALATPWDCVEQCSMETLSLVPRRKVASSGPTFKIPSRCAYAHQLGFLQNVHMHMF